MPDWYEVVEIVMRTSNITLQHHYLVNEQVIDLKVPATNTSSPLTGSPPKVAVWAQKSNCKAMAAVHSKIHLERLRAISIRLSTGRNEIQNVKLIVRARTAGLRLHTTDAEVVNNACNIIDAEKPSTIKLGAMQPDSLVEVKIPYRLDDDIKEINLRFDMIYDTVRGTFTYGDCQNLFVPLPLGVNVQDVFKKDSLFSKFAISTSTSIPLRVLNCCLEETSDFKVTSPSLDRDHLCVFIKQPMSLVYRITCKSARKSMRPMQKKLSMMIDYQCFDDEIVSAAEHCLTKAIERSDFDEYTGLLTWYLQVVLRRRIPQQDLDTMALLRKYSLPEFSQLAWNSILEAVPPERRQFLELWLQEWHKVRIEAMSITHNLMEC